MAIGSRYNPTNYLSMANQAATGGAASARAVGELYQRGFNIGVQEEERQRLVNARNEFETAWMSDDPEDVQRVIARYPEFAAKIQQGIGIQDDQQRQKVGGMAMQLNGLLESGNIQGAQDYIRQNASLFERSGPYSADSVIASLGQAAADPQKLQQWKDWSKKLPLATLKSGEIVDFGLKQQQLAQQLEMQNNALAQQLQIANQNLGARYAQINAMDRRQANMLNRPSPAVANWEFMQTLSPEAQKQFMALLPGGGGLAGGARGASPAGMQKAQLVDGRTVDIFPKVQKQGSNVFYQGIDENGFMVNVPKDSIVSAISGDQAAGEAMTAADLKTLKDASGADLSPITGAFRRGRLGEMPIGSEVYTGYTNTGREAFSAAKRIQGRMQNQGISAAREMGASGINTVAEAKMFFQSMPQLDFSNEQALRTSVERINDYINKTNRKFNVKTGNNADAASLSDTDLLKGL